MNHLLAIHVVGKEKAAVRAHFPTVKLMALICVLLMGTSFANETRSSYQLLPSQCDGDLHHWLILRVDKDAPFPALCHKECSRLMNSGWRYSPVLSRQTHLGHSHQLLFSVQLEL